MFLGVWSSLLNLLNPNSIGLIGFRLAGFGGFVLGPRVPFLPFLGAWHPHHNQDTNSLNPNTNFVVLYCNFRSLPFLG